MGQDKALIPIDGIPLIRRIYEAAAPCCSPVYVVSQWCDRYRAVLPDACRFVTENVTKSDALLPSNGSADMQPQDSQRLASPQDAQNAPGYGARFTHGHLIGFYQGLNHLVEISSMPQSEYQADGEWVLLLACDLPNIRADGVQQWCDWLSHTGAKRFFDTPDAPMAFLPPHGTKGWHPLCGFYRLQCLSSLQTFINEGGRSFQKWLASPEVKLSVHPLPVDDPNILFNCNTPRDLAQFQ